MGCAVGVEAVAEPEEILKAGLGIETDNGRKTAFQSYANAYRPLDLRIDMQLSAIYLSALYEVTLAEGAANGQLKHRLGCAIDPQVAGIDRIPHDS